MRTKRLAVALSAAAVLSTSSSSTHEAPSETASAVITADSPPEMEVRYIVAEDADPHITDIQQRTGYAAMQAALGQPFTMRIGGTQYAGAINAPRDPQAREQTIAIAQDSAQAGTDILNDRNPPRVNDRAVSFTRYWLKIGEDQALVRTGPAMSAVGQEGGTTEPIRSSVTQHCLPAELSANPLLTQEHMTEYQLIMNAFCNSLASATTSAYTNGAAGYTEYSRRYTNLPVGQDINPAGLDATYPVLSEDLYNRIIDNLAGRHDTSQPG